jgi:hypothetical protein
MLVAKKDFGPQSRASDRELFWRLGGAEIYHEWPTEVVQEGGTFLGTTLSGPAMFRGLFHPANLTVCNGLATFTIDLPAEGDADWLQSKASSDGWEIVG